MRTAIRWNGIQRRSRLVADGGYGLVGAGPPRRPRRKRRGSAAEEGKNERQQRQGEAAARHMWLAGAAGVEIRYKERGRGVGEQPAGAISYAIGLPVQSWHMNHPISIQRSLLFWGAAILRSPVNIDAVRSIFGQGHVASVFSKIYVQMMIALCLSVPLSSGFRMPAILHACA